MPFPAGKPRAQEFLGAKGFLSLSISPYFGTFGTKKSQGLEPIGGRWLENAEGCVVAKLCGTRGGVRMENSFWRGTVLVRTPAPSCRTIPSARSLFL